MTHSACHVGSACDRLVRFNGLARVYNRRAEAVLGNCGACPCNFASRRRCAPTPGSDGHGYGLADADRRLCRRRAFTDGRTFMNRIITAIALAAATYACNDSSLEAAPTQRRPNSRSRRGKTKAVRLRLNTRRSKPPRCRDRNCRELGIQHSREGRPQARIAPRSGGSELLRQRGVKKTPRFRGVQVRSMLLTWSGGERLRHPFRGNAQRLILARAAPLECRRNRTRL